MKQWLLILGLIALTACVSDAPHDNPLDNPSGDGQFSLNGTVFSYYPPYKPLSNAFVFLLPARQAVFSDANGKFSFKGVTGGSYTLICSAAGYATDTVQVDVNQSVQHDFYLDALPYFETIYLRTHHVSRWFPVEDTYYLEVQATVNDPDGIGDLRKVWFTIPEFAFSDTLQAGIVAGQFEKSVPENQLPVGKIARLIGKEIILFVQDDPGSTTQSIPHFLTRIVQPTPVLIAPIGLSTVNPDSLVFQWQPVVLDYPFTFKVQLFQINLGVLTTVDEIGNIPGDQTSYWYRNVLPSGEYFWRVFVVDEYGNTSSSKEGAFRVP